MAQDETPDSSSSSSSSSTASASSAARLNAAAPEFTPRSAAQHHHANPHRQQHGAHHANHHYQPHHHQHKHHHHTEEEGDAAATASAAAAAEPGGQAQRGLSDDVSRRVVKQVEFYFSDVNLATTDHLMKFIARDPEGFVPMPVAASFRKIRELVYDRSLLAAALRTSSELVVSEDGKKIRRRLPFTEADAEEVQSRIVVAENLPEEHRYQNLMKIFSAFGSVKSIRTCYPQGADGAGASASKASRIEMLFANKLHAFVEYGTVEDAEKAVAELSGGRSWRDGIRVRSLLGCLKHVMGQGRKGGDEEYAADQDGPETAGHPQEYGTEDDASQISEAHLEHQADDGVKQGRGRGRGGRGRGRGQYHGHSRDLSHPIGTPPSNHSAPAEHPAVPKPPPGPRMPDGTKGFTMGRGKMLNPSNAS